MAEKNYDDIIRLAHPTSKKHPRMSMENRAAQFSPFAALTGYEAAVQETARLTDARIELDEEEMKEINEQLRVLEKNPSQRQTVVVTYFVPDSRKEGGAYVTRSGAVKKVRSFERILLLEDGTQIPIENIAALQLQKE